MKSTTLYLHVHAGLKEGRGFLNKQDSNMTVILTIILLHDLPTCRVKPFKIHVSTYFENLQKSPVTLKFDDRFFLTLSNNHWTDLNFSTT